MDAPLQAIAEPNRRRILEILAESHELSSGAIATHFRQTPAAVSQHLGVLEDAGLVSTRRVGTRRLYRLRGEGFQELRAYLERFWARGLERLRTETEGRPAPRRPGRNAHGPRAGRRRRRA